MNSLTPLPFPAHGSAPHSGRLLATRPGWKIAAGLGWALGLLPLAGTAADQPQWGQAWSRNPVSAEQGLPDGFDPATKKNVKWVVELGSQTHSTPVVAGGRVFIGTNNANPRDPRHQGDRGVFISTVLQSNLAFFCIHRSDVMA